MPLNLNDLGAQVDAPKLSPGGPAKQKTSLDQSFMTKPSKVESPDFAPEPNDQLDLTKTHQFSEKLNDKYTSKSPFNNTTEKSEEERWNNIEGISKADDFLLSQENDTIPYASNTKNGPGYDLLAKEKPTAVNLKNFGNKK